MTKNKRARKTKSSNSARHNPSRRPTPSPAARNAAVAPPEPNVAADQQPPNSEAALNQALLLSPETDITDTQRHQRHDGMGQFDDSPADPTRGIFDDIPGWYRVGGIADWLFFFFRILPVGLLYYPRDVWERFTGRKQFCIPPFEFQGEDGGKVLVYQSSPGFLHMVERRDNTPYLLLPHYTLGFFHTHYVFVQATEAEAQALQKKSAHLLKPVVAVNSVMTIPKLVLLAHLIINCWRHFSEYSEAAITVGPISPKNDFDFSPAKKVTK